MDWVKNQHYVPQAYLRNFAISGRESLYCFNKDSGEILEKPTSIRNIASERYFYDIKGIDEQIVEKIFGKLEDDFGPFIKRFKAKCDLHKKGVPFSRSAPVLTEVERNYLSSWLAVQFLRTRDMRDIILEVYNKIALELKIHGIDEDFELEKSDHPYVHSLVLFGTKIYSTTVQIFKDLIWTVGVNTTRFPLYTSDTPVQSGNAKHNISMVGGFQSEGSFVTYPLSSEYILVLQERSYFANQYEVLENKLVPVTIDGVNLFNRMQVLGAYRMVFCQQRKFEFAQAVHKRTIKSGNRVSHGVIADKVREIVKKQLIE